ncbi:hypothetical protein FVE85_4252 [Porphyridium purpureum]|uniref:DUF1279 domain-containing protein n=1 Tax=Porphyridium purpureum TaxID=35688 RepID=A0A5J4YV55_PORPP|nr:hypothetical protein FVE85_4252 [Porphyridium purpureum]|eukprot:POR8363..scf229_5
MTSNRMRAVMFVSHGIARAGRVPSLTPVLQSTCPLGGVRSGAARVAFTFVARGYSNAGDGVTQRARSALYMAVDEKEKSDAAGSSPKLKSDDPEQEAQSQKENRSKAEQAKQLAMTYGPAFFLTSAGSSVISISAWYLIVRSGVDVAATMEAIGDYLGTTPIGRPAVFDRISPEMSAFALAYIAHKASSPLRFPLVVAALPFVAKLIGKKNVTPS